MQSQTFKIVLAVVITAIVVGGGIFLWQKRASAPPIVTETSKSAANETPQPTITTIPKDKIHIGSEDDPSLGLAGYSSGTIRVGDSHVQITLYSNDRKKVSDDAFPCEEGRPVTAVKGTYKIAAEANLNGLVLDTLLLGEQEFVIEPYEIEQNGLFTKMVVLQKEPRQEAFALPLRDSCQNTKVYLYTFNSSTKKVETVKFVNQRGVTNEFVYIPKGVGIPQIDGNNNIIESVYNENTGGRTNVRYTFDPDHFQYQAIESYAEPQRK